MIRTSYQNENRGPVNIPLEPHTFAINRERACDYLNTRERLYCFDGFAGWDPNYQIKVRVICSRPYHALFMHTMLIRPTRASRRTRAAHIPSSLSEARRFPAWLATRQISFS